MSDFEQSGSLGTAKEAESHSSQDYLSFGFPVFLLSESVVFLSFFVAYIILRVRTLHWFPTGVAGLDVHKALINTCLLVASSGVIHLAEQALQKGKVSLFRRLWLLTISMGIIFLFGQAAEWRDMPFGLDDGPAGATFYLLTGFHGLHVLAGLLLMLLMYFRSLYPNNYHSGHGGVKATALFWHFVDVIWIILFFLLYIW